MSQFQVGDRVIAASTGDVGEAFRGLIGTVVDHQAGTGYPYVDFDDPPPGTEHGTPDKKGKAQGGTWPGPCLLPLDLGPSEEEVAELFGTTTPAPLTEEQRALAERVWDEAYEWCSDLFAMPHDNHNPYRRS